jgi:hypothetical protein
MPLSAFAPRILSVKSMNEIKLPSSPEEVRLQREERSNTPRAAVRQNENAGRKVDMTPKVKDGAGGGAGGGLSRFMFSGEVVRTSQVL